MVVKSRADKKNKKEAELAQLVDEQNPIETGLLTPDMCTGEPT